MTVTPVVAAVTTLCAALALSGVIEGLRWWGYAGVAVTVVTATGLGLRAVRTPVLLVGLGQMFALLCLLVALFTDDGILGFLPGPSAIGDLGDVLGNSVEVVQSGVPPVSATQAVLCLVVISIGLVAVLVDTLAVSAGTPAASGLVLLCVYAVPASLADEMLPWWAFVLGAISFAALLWVDGAHRHQAWRNRPSVQGTSGGLGSPSALVSSAVVIALFVGATFTVIGTVGQLPGGSGGSGGGGLGLNPFTSLRGMLDRDGNVELFRVRNLGSEARYLRALTLPEYNEDGWLRRDADQMPRGFTLQGQLPLPPGREDWGGSDIEPVEIEPINSQDVWAPYPGQAVQVRGLPDDIRYDPESGAVYGEESETLPRYTVETDLAEPTAEQLRAAGSLDSGGEIDDLYLANDGIDEQIVELANQVVAGQNSTFDKVRALEEFFHGDDFTYDTQTASGSSEDALVDFVLRSKVGFCEQYASAMAIMLRAVGIPSRVAMGYTSGYVSGDYRTITNQNAHAWVEVFFSGIGWTQFDPTPLSDGTNYTPPYASETNSAEPSDPANSPSESAAPTTPVNPSAGAEEPGEEENAGADGNRDQDAGLPWQIWAAGGTAILALALTGGAVANGRRGRRRGQPLLIALAVGAWVVTIGLLAALVSWWLSTLVLVLLAAAAPGLVRERRRLARRHQVHTGSTDAATSAWNELIAESRDRGTEVIPTETVRVTARRLAREHSLDDDGRQALRTVVGEVERSWYGGRTEPDPGLAQAFDRLMAGIRRNDPIGWRARILPRSVLRRR